MRALIALLVAGACWGQLAPSVSSTYNVPSNAGDTQFFTWTSAATRAGNWGGGSIIGQYNDGFGFGVNGGPGHNQLGIFEITAYDKTIPSVTTAPINGMSSYGTASTSCYNGVDYTFTRKPFGFDGHLFLNINCSDTTSYTAKQSGLIVSPDGGAHWCNYKTFLAHATSPDCDSSNWKSDGDNPTDTSGFQMPYHSAFDGKFDFLSLVDFMCQDQTIGCPVASGVDPAYLYFMGLPGSQATLHVLRIAKSVGWKGVMNPANWEAYNAGSWTSTLQNASDVKANMSGTGSVMWDGLGSGSVSYLKDFGVFIALDHYGPTTDQHWATATSPLGPWTDQTLFAWSVGGYTPSFTNLIPGLCPKYDVAGRVTCTVSGTDLGGYNWRVSEWDLGPYALPPLSSVGTARPGRMRFPTGMRVAMVSPSRALSVTVVGTSNTQAILAYTAPNSSPCTVHVSESAGMTPLVHDVDSTLFTGADSDSRTGAFSATTNRIFVVGKRMTDRGLDGASYSRALQANQTHYYSVACTGATVTATFATTNIPIGSTYTELPQMDSSTALAVVPTFPDNRTTTVIDQQTGILAKKVWISTDGSPLGLYSGGRIPMCGYNLVGPDNGYLCGFPNLAGNSGEIYYIIPATGEVRLLGNLSVYAPEVPYGGGAVAVTNPVFDPSDSHVIWTAADNTSQHGALLKLTYNGNYAAVSPGTSASFTATNVTLEPNNIGARLHAFDSTFDNTKFPCGFISGGLYGLITCHRSTQDSYGWMFAMDMTTMTVVAGFNVTANPKTRWCGVHSPFIVANTPLAIMLPHGLTSGLQDISNGGNGLALGPYRTTLTAGISATDTTITVAGEPLSAADTTIEPYLMDAAIGDQFVVNWGGTSEYIKITGKSGTTWTVQRHSAQAANDPSRSWAAGTILQADCGSQDNAFWYDTWWQFLSDPTASGSGYTSETYLWGGHEDIAPNGKVAERAGWIGPITSGINQPPTFNLPTNPVFAGAEAHADGNTYTDYPTYQQLNATTAEKQWFLDEPGFMGADQLGQFALISGKTQLYKYTFSDWGGLNRKQFATIAVSGQHGLTDISGPAAAISDGSAGAYTYCVANAANECVAGSSVGYVYANVPGTMVYSNCHGVSWDHQDLCITNLALNGAYQFGTAANSFAYTRQLSGGFSNLKAFGGIFKPTAAAEWGFINKGSWGSAESAMLMVKMPPFPAPDGVNRSTFVRAPISITTPGGLGIASATVEFGYVEQGTPTQYYCTSRREACVAVASTVNDATPFWYKTTDSYTKASCATSCTITLPVLPLHVAYYQVKFYDGSGNFVQNGATGIALEGTVR